MRDDSDLTPVPRENLSGAQRWLLGLGGLVFGGIGVAAIFLAENEAGSAVALLICGVLVLVAIQGTKVQRISADENSVDFAQVRASVARQAEDVAKQDPQAAESLMDTYEAADPLAGVDPAFVNARGTVYESQVAPEVRRIIAEIQPNFVQIDGPADLTLQVDGRTIAVEARYRQPGRKLYLQDGRQLKARLSKMKADALLVVSNVPPTTPYSAEMPPSTRTVVWRSEEDSELIRNALHELLS